MCKQLSSILCAILPALFVVGLRADVLCSYLINPASQSFDATGGTGRVTVTTQVGCPWTADSNPDAPWIHIPLGTGGNNSGAVDYSVDPMEPIGSRVGTITIAGQPFTVEQNGSNTPTGSNVTVQLGAIAVNFASVTASGATKVTQSGPPIMPPGFTIFEAIGPPIMPGFSVDISTTATVTGPINVTFDLSKLMIAGPPITPQVFSRLRVLHGERITQNGPPILVDRTITGPPITPPNLIQPIFARVSSLSPFVIAQISDKVVFSSNRDGNFEIYSMNSDGTGATRLTNNPAVDLFPAWSPDRGRIAFTSNRNGNFDIYSVNADGSSPVRLTVNARIDGVPAWSPDGSKIAFTSNRDGNFEIYVMNPDGTGLTRLTNTAAADAKPTWSPDGTKIAFTSNRNGNFEIYSMNADGTGVTRLTNNPAVDASPAWSPDGTKIAFTSNRNGLFNIEIYVMNADGSGPVRLTSNPAVDGEPGWSPDGAKIVFSTNRDGLFNLEVYVMNADGSGQTRLTTNASTDISPQW